LNIKKHNYNENDKYVQLIDEVHSQLPKRLRTRLVEIQKWLSIDDETVKRWEVLGLAMNDWLAEYLRKNKNNIQYIQNKFPVLWKKFLLESKLSDAIVPKFK